MADFITFMICVVVFIRDLYIVLIGLYLGIIDVPAGSTFDDLPRSVIENIFTVWSYCAFISILPCSVVGAVYVFIVRA